MAKKTENGGKFINFHCKTTNETNNLTLHDNQKHPLDDLKNDEITEKREK